MEEEVKVYTWYRWDCPMCGEVNDIENFHSGEKETCCGCTCDVILKGE